MNNKSEKKELALFLLVAYGLTYLMGILMWMGYGKADLSAFPNAQMLYPAAGVGLAHLVVRREDPKVPRLFYGFFILLTAALAIAAVVTVLSPQSVVSMPGGEFPAGIVAVQYLLIGGSILFWILLLVSGKEKRAAYGLGWSDMSGSWFCILVFFLIYIGRTVVLGVIGGSAEEVLRTLFSSTALIYLVMLPINFFLGVAAFFGEEYGWRYYLQPLLQKRFGLRGGVLVLGVVWALWHLPIDFFYYTSPGDGLIMLAGQVVTCVSIGIFMAWAYMKTNNIWVPVIIHFLNNNLIPMITGTYSAEVIEGQSASWGEIPLAILINGLAFGFFLLAREFRGKQKMEIDES